MKNDSIVEGIKISIPPTLMITVVAKMIDVTKAITMDVKRPGDLVYIVGETFDELGGSEYYQLIGEKIRGKKYIGNKVPKVNAKVAKAIYQHISYATERELVHSIPTPTKGGLGVALALSAFAGDYGIDIHLDKVPYRGVRRDDFLLFSESNSRFIVTVPIENKEEFEKVMKGCVYMHVGFIVKKPILRIRGLDGDDVIQANLQEIKRAWKGTLEGI